tara:strand:+ start:787 stop:963 length:177 start_codon:yes stop_codon:yes gene_type:complete
MTKKILIRAVPGALHVTIDGKTTVKPMTEQTLVELAEDCLRASIDMHNAAYRQAAEVA